MSDKLTPLQFVKQWIESHESDTFIRNEHGQLIYSAGPTRLNLECYFEDLLKDYIDHHKEKANGGKLTALQTLAKVSGLQESTIGRRYQWVLKAMQEYTDQETPSLKEGLDKWKGVAYKEGTRADLLQEELNNVKSNLVEINKFDAIRYMELKQVAQQMATVLVNISMHYKDEFGSNESLEAWDNLNK